MAAAPGSPRVAVESDWLAEVAGEVSLFDRTSTAERVADVLRARITAGQLPPGSRLPEEHLVEALSVSRNTLREAFRLLTHEGLLVHRMHRGVFVPEPLPEDLVDLYRLRRTLECDVVRRLDDDADLGPLDDAVTAGEEAAGRGDWLGVGTANMRFHQHLVGLAGSRRMNRLADRLLAELRLAFHVVASPQRLHQPYVGRNRALLAMIAAGERDRAVLELDSYLHDSEAQLLAAFAERRP